MENYRMILPPQLFLGINLFLVRIFNYSKKKKKKKMKTIIITLLMCVGTINSYAQNINCYEIIRKLPKHNVWEIKYESAQKIKNNLETESKYVSFDSEYKLKNYIEALCSFYLSEGGYVNYTNNSIYIFTPNLDEVIALEYPKKGYGNYKVKQTIYLVL